MMEFNLMNELLMSTVASLFTENEPRAAREEVKTGVPRQIVVKVDSRGTTSSVASREVSVSSISSGPLMEQQKQDMQSTIRSWLESEGRKKLSEAMRRLNLDHHAVQGRGLGSMTLDDLLHEKKSVKNELKVYD